MPLVNAKTNVPAQIASDTQTITDASGTAYALLRNGTIVLNTAGTPNVVLGTPQVGDRLVIVGLGAGAVTVTLPTGITWDGTNRVATFGSGKALNAICVSATRMFVLSNVGAVAFS